MKRKVKAIVALDKNNGMSVKGKIPWRVKEDFQYFKRYTEDKTCVMGRITYSDLLTYSKNKQDPLPGRKIILVTSNPIDGVRCVTSLDSLNSSFLDEELVLCGGKKIYEEGFKIFHIEELSVTRIFGDYECDNHLVIPENLTCKETFWLAPELAHTVWLYN